MGQGRPGHQGRAGQGRTGQDRAGQGGGTLNSILQ